MSFSYSVQVVTSHRAGMGKSLYVQRVAEELEKTSEVHTVIIPVHGPEVSPALMISFLSMSEDQNLSEHRIVYHYDIASNVRDVFGVE